MPIFFAQVETHAGSLVLCRNMYDSKNSKVFSIFLGYSNEKTQYDWNKASRAFVNLEDFVARIATPLMWSWNSPPSQVRTGAGDLIFWKEGVTLWNDWAAGNKICVLSESVIFMAIGMKKYTMF